MKQLTPEQIVNNWNELIQLIEGEFDGERKEKLLEMYKYFEDRMSIAPASGKEHYHNAYVGGYVEHVLHVYRCAVSIKQQWEEKGATINFTDEELAMAAIHHELGKVGDLYNEYYTPNESDWHRKNQGLIFSHNGDLQFMTVTDRALFLLQHFGISLTENEYIGLRLTDGLYEEANKPYYIGYSPDRQLKSNIAYILHQADSMATHIEYDMWKRGEEKITKNIKQVVAKEVKKVEKEEKVVTKGANDLFDELFGDMEK